MKKALALITILLVTTMSVWSNAKSEEAAAPKAAATTNEIVPEEGAVLTIWESEGAEGEFIEYAAGLFEAEYGVKVNYQSIESTDAATRMDQDGPAGTGPDVFATPHDRLGTLLVAGHIMENLVSADRINNDFMGAAKVAASAEGKVWAFPTAIETYGLFYNKDVIAEAPASYEELVEWGKGFTNKAENKYGIFWEVGNAYFNYSFLAADGGYMFGENGTDASDLGVNNAGAVRGAEAFASLKAIGVENSGDADYGTMMGLFQEGKAATMINGPWALQDLKNAGTNFGVAPLPTLNGQNPKSFSGVRLLVVSAYSKYPKAAQLFAEFVTTDEMLLKRFEMTAQIPPVKALVNEPAIANDEFVLPFLKQAGFAEPMPSIPEMALTWDPMGAAWGDIWNGALSPQEGLDAAAATIEEAIASQN